MEYTGVLNVRYEAGSACELATGVIPVQIIETIIFISIYFVINIYNTLQGVHPDS